MPAKRISDLASFRYTPVNPVRSTKEKSGLRVREILGPQAEMTASPSPKIDYSSECDVYYPLTGSEREAFRTAAGKRVPPHHWAVYDLIRKIPAGRVSTYKDVCAAVGQGSPRSVGGALRNNPFAPRIPCHRVIASSLFVGGFKGEWAPSSAVVREDTNCDLNLAEDATAKIRNWHEPFRGGGMGALQNEKLRMLVQEGVVFGKGGKMSVNRDAVLWQFEANE